jgi:type II protein arginine methyltransferase
MTELARRALEPIAAQARGDARKLAAVCSMALTMGDGERAYSLACEARRLLPDDPYILSATQAAITTGVPHWHFRIVRDEERNAAWNAAIERAVHADSTVLDVGAGSGLLSMMAARAGAGRVVACEMNPAVADAAARVVDRNGYSDRITIVPVHSRDLTVQQMGDRADVFVSEIISNNVVGQDSVATVRDVVGRLLKAGGKVIPAATTARVALAWWGGAALKRLQEIDGFDLGEFNILQALPHEVHRDDPALLLRSDPAALFEFDFQRLRFPDPVVRLDLPATGGPINGVVQWIRIQLDEEVVYENMPGMDGRSCWACLFHPFAETIAPPEGTPVAVGGEYTGSNLRIWKADERA